MRRFWDNVLEKVIKTSGFLTSIIIVLIIVFLFKEGVGLFSSPVVEKGYTVVVNSQNKVTQISPEEIKQIFDSEIDNWKELGGLNQPIRVFRIDDIFSMYTDEELGEDYKLLPQKLEEIIQNDPGIIAYLPKQYTPISKKGVKELASKTISVSDFLMGKEWLPTATPSPLFGIIPLVLGTVLVSFVAILIALPLGVGVAIYLAEIAGDKTRKVIRPAIELLAGIPSVVYGFFGLVVLVPIVQKAGGLPVGETAFTGSLILAIMALPTIISISEDALRNVPKMMKDASYALGASKWQTIYKVSIPYAASGISAAIILGVGRAIGETMAVLMVTGNGAVIPHTMFESVRTIPATIAAELGEAPSGGAHYQSLFLLGVVLFFITLIMSVISNFILSKKSIKK